MSSQINPTKHLILKSALSLLEAGGGSGVRMSDIAKAAKISRQAVYLHFPTRAELLIATTHYLDDINDVEAKLVGSRTAQGGAQRLTEWIEVWGNYIPKIYGVAKALISMKDADPAAQAAWDDRMNAVRLGSAAAIAALEKEGALRRDLHAKEATDLLSVLLSVGTWEQLTQTCGWSQSAYIAHLRLAALKLLTD